MTRTDWSAEAVTSDVRVWTDGTTVVLTSRATGGGIVEVSGYDIPALIEALQDLPQRPANI